MNAASVTQGYIRTPDLINGLTAGNVVLPQEDISIFENLLTLLGTIGILVLVMFLAYRFTKIMKKRSSGESMHGGYIEIVERVMIGPERSIIIVRLKDKLLLLGVTPNHIEKLDELDPEMYTNVQAAHQGTENFSSLLREVIGRDVKPKNLGKKDHRDE